MKRRDAEKVGRAIGCLRVWRGLTQTELAAKAGLSPAHISLLEAGRRNFTMDCAKKISSVLGVSFLTLLKLSEGGPLKGIQNGG